VKFGKCSVAIALMTTQVYAADLPLVSAKPVVAPLREIPVYKWTSFYAGAMFGWGFGRNSINLSGNGPDEAAAIANGLVPSRLPTTRNDWLAGATLGYNYQFGRVVFSLETDYAGTGFSGSNSFSNTGCQTFNGLGTGGPCGMNLTTNGVVSSNISNEGTLRLRAGYLLTDRLLGYVTGGIAYGQWGASEVGGITGCAAGTCFNDYSGSKTGYGLGPAAGVGFEYMLTSSWSIKTEGMFTSLGTQTVSVTSPTAAALGYPLGFNETVKTDMLSVKGGVSYHFNLGN